MPKKKPATDPNIDADGYTQIFSEITEGRLSTKQTKMLAALAMIRAGGSITGTAKKCGIPYSTLYHQNRGLIVSDDYERTFKKGERRLVNGLLAIASLASEKIFERVENESMTDTNLIRAQAVATDRVSAYRNWGRSRDRSADGEGISALAKLLQGKRVTVEPVEIAQPADPADTAIDVTPTPIDSID